MRKAVHMHNRLFTFEQGLQLHPISPMAAKFIERFTPTLVVAICDCVRPVADACMAERLITSETRDDILGSTVMTSKDKTRKLLEAVKNCTEINSESCDIFLRILRENLPEKISSKLLTDMGTEPSERGQATPVEASTALVPSGHEAMRNAHHGQLFLPHIAVSRLLHREQNPYMGKLEESIREHERTIAERNQLKEENERLKAQLANMQSLQSSSNTSQNQGTTTGISMPEAEILQLKEEIEKLKQKSKDFDGEIEELERKSKHLDDEISRYRCALDIQGDKILQKYIENQYNWRFQKFERSVMKDREFERELVSHQYEQKFQEFKRSMMKYREFEREHGSHYELDPEEGSAMNYRESEREAR